MFAKIRSFLLFLICFSVAPPVTDLVARDWLRFRGPNGSGVSDESSLPVEFGREKNLSWRTAVPHSASSPIVSHDRVFLTASEGDTLMTIAVDRDTGEALWRKEIERTFAHEIYEGNDPASPTPASDGENVYVFFPDVGLLSYGPDGDERWRLKLGPFANFYGMAGSPVVTGDSVYLVCDQLSGSFLIAVDKDSGHVRWKSDRPGQGLGYSTPIVRDQGEAGTVVITTGSSKVIAYAVESGDEVWSFNQSGFPPQGVPTLDGPDLLFISSGSDRPLYPPHATMLSQFDTNGDKLMARSEFTDEELLPHFGYFDQNTDGLIDADEWEFALKDGVGQYGMIRLQLRRAGEISPDAVLWRYKKGLPYVPAPLLYDGVLYLVKDAGIVTALDPKTGTVLKVGRSREALGPYFASPVAGEGKVYLASKQGKLTVLRAGPQWEILSVNDLGEEIYATPAIANDSIYVRTRAALYRFIRPE